MSSSQCSGPRLRNMLQRTEVDFGVEGGGGQILMSQNGTDIDQRHTVGQQCRRQARVAVDAPPLPATRRARQARPTTSPSRSAGTLRMGARNVRKTWRSCVLGRPR